jgi:hypothetical protein
MIVASIAAFILPFEVFLFSYAVLGPLHYLTEISWLHKRDYFATGKNDFIVLILLCVFLFIFNFIFKEYSLFSNVFIFAAVLFALGTVLFKNFFYKIILVVFGLVVGAAIQTLPPFIYSIGVFLPTLVHVFLFTGLFILHGALKNKSVTGIASLLVFVACAVSFFVWHPNFSFYKVSSYAETALIESTFIQLNKIIIQLFNLGEFTRENVFESNVGLGIMRFIAFAYTYHYLNWFSKTQVIKWHQVPKKQLVAVVAIWLFSIALYAYDYYIGLVALYFLSMLHVLLEFPLNYRSFIGIGEEVSLLAGWSTPVAAKKK